MGIFNEEELAAAAETAPPEEKQEEGQQPPAQQDDRPRDEHGRFAPKQQEEEPPQQQGKDPQERTVEHGALHSERERRKHWEGEAKRAQEQLAAIAELRKKVQGGAQDQQQQPPPPVGQQPQEETTEQLRARLARLEQAEQRRGQATDHARLDDLEHRNLAQALVSAEADFSARVPDYNDATTHLATSRARELQRYGMDPVSIQQTLAEEALEITRTAIGMGRSPAELAYEIAQDRGYQPRQGGQPKPNGGGNGSAVAMVEAIRRGQESSKSLGSGGGTGGAGDINAQSLAAMSEDEFAHLYSTPEGRRLIDSLS